MPEIIEPLIYGAVRAAVKYAELRNKPCRIKKLINEKNTPKYYNLSNEKYEGFKASAVQVKVDIFKNCRSYIDKMYCLTKTAADEGAGLVVFPELNGMMILGMLPLFERVVKAFSQNELEGNKKNPTIKVDLIRILSILSPFLKRFFEETFSELSRVFGLYIMSGSIFLEDEGKIYNRAYLFGPEGQVIGTQDKLHLMEIEKSMGLSPGTRINVFDTRIGRLAMPICMDASYYETFKILKKKGAEVIMLPIANMEEYNYYLALRGIWPRIQESGVYGIKSALAGEIAGVRFTGKSGVFAPLMLTLNSDGVIAEAKEYDREDVVTGEIDPGRLKTYFDPYFCDTNTKLYSRYLPDIYNQEK